MRIDVEGWENVAYKFDVYHQRPPRQIGFYINRHNPRLFTIPVKAPGDESLRFKMVALYLTDYGKLEFVKDVRQWKKNYPEWFIRESVRATQYLYDFFEEEGLLI